jgi:hypothetical protein
VEAHAETEVVTALSPSLLETPEVVVVVSQGPETRVLETLVMAQVPVMVLVTVMQMALLESRVLETPVMVTVALLVFLVFLVLLVAFLVLLVVLVFLVVVAAAAGSVQPAAGHHLDPFHCSWPCYELVHHSCDLAD